MSLPTVQALLSHHDDLMEWVQPFLFRTADGIINLAPVIGPEAHTPDDARNQPSHYPQFCHTKHTTHYRFDPEIYNGKDSLERLLKDVRSSLNGAKFWSNRLVSRSNYSIQELTCSLHAVAKRRRERKILPEE